MKNITVYCLMISISISIFLGVSGIAGISSAHEDMRDTAVKARELRESMLEKARAEKKEAVNEAEKSKTLIFQDRSKLKQAIAGIQKDNTRLKKSNNKLKADIKTFEQKEKNLKLKLAEMDAVVKELVGFIRINAKDLKSMLSLSLQSAFADERLKIVDKLTNKDKFPGMADIMALADILKDEIERSSEVRMEKGLIIDQAGREVEAEILVLGNFTAAYKKDDKVGFLLYSEKSHRLFALSKEPPLRMQKKIRSYMNGEIDDVPLDMSKGGAMRQLTHKLSLVKQIPKGGPVVWPILIIAVIAVLIILERFIYLARKNINDRSFMKNIKDLMLKENFDGCRKLCSQYAKKPLARAISAGLEFKDRNREDMENALQEAILREIPPLEKFLSTLGMLAAIAPLLGLLGTVTGMINTFHVITFHGTSDPRMMSGGISEALVTTMLGLSVAIPIMLCHTILSRKVETMISTMEEKAVAFVNAVLLTR
ncbi:MAG: MotA/TolQ/ExbB proton channel family protein [Thermodesulfobacteriota bacterium]|nr:MotA/TolQ/ExbB proton channel family protein [Thermodesulfobacteriota bacterium]